MSESNRPRRLRRGIVACAAGLALALSALYFLQRLGLRYQGFSARWQALLILASAVVVLGTLSWTVLAPERARAGQQAIGAPRRNTALRLILHGLVWLVLFLLFVGVRSWPEPAEEPRSVVLVRMDTSFVPAATATPPLFLVRDASNQAEILFDEDYRLVLDTDADQRFAGASVYTFSAKLSKRTQRWLGVGAHRWPIGQPPAELVVSRAIDPAPLAGKFGPVHVGNDGPAFALEWLLVPSMPILPIAFPDPIERLDDPGFKPMLNDAEGLTVTPLKLFQWSVLPAKTAPLAEKDLKGRAAYSVLVESRQESNPTDQTPASVLWQGDVMSVTYQDGLPEYFLRRIALNVSVDTLGDAGLRQGLAELDGASRIWRSRRYAAAGACVVPLEPPVRRPATVADLARDRFLPAPSPSAKRDTRAHVDFPYNGPLVLVAMLLILLCALLPHRS